MRKILIILIVFCSCNKEKENTQSYKWIRAKSYSQIDSTTATTYVKLTLSSDVKGINLITSDTVLDVTIFWVNGINNNQLNIFFPKGDSIYNYILFQQYYLNPFVPVVNAISCSDGVLCTTAN